MFFYEKKTPVEKNIMNLLNKDFNKVNKLWNNES